MISAAADEPAQGSFNISRCIACCNGYFQKKKAVKRCGEDCAKLTDYKEYFKDLLQLKITDSLIDLFNNDVGRELGSLRWDTRQCADKCREAKLKGRLK